VHAPRETWRGAWHGPRGSRAVLPVALATGRAPAAAGARLLALWPWLAAIGHAWPIAIIHWTLALALLQLRPQQQKGESDDNH